MHDNPTSASQNLQHHLNLLSDWYDNWRVKVNQSKSLHTTFTLRIAPCPEVSLADIPIPSSQSVKYLGLTIDHRLTWAQHYAVCIDVKDRDKWRFRARVADPKELGGSLVLNQGAIVILLRNLNVVSNLMNSTRFVVRNIYDRSLDLESITDQGTGQRILLPRIDLTPSDSTLSFSFTGRQFPIRIAFAITINNAQGQTLDKVGLCLSQPVFSHGQLYAAMSRKQDPIRKYFKIVGIDEKRQSCKFCSNEYNLNVNKMKSHLLKCLQCRKETKKKFKKSTTQISTLDVNEYDVTDDLQVQVQSTSKEVRQLQIQQHSKNFSRFFDRMDKGENFLLIQFSLSINERNRGLLELDVDKLYNKYLCQEHFSSNDFMQGNKKSLKPTAIPYRYNVTSEEEPSTSAGTSQLQFLTPTKTYYKPRAADTAVELVFTSSTPEKKRY
ncbi:hypothetical protein QTP88_005663 [Uroleucon formosanum]